MKRLYNVISPIVLGKGPMVLSYYISTSQIIRRFDHIPGHEHYWYKIFDTIHF